MTDQQGAPDDGSVFIPQELVDAYLEGRRTGIVEAKEHYFSHLMPVIREPLESLPKHRELRELGYETLVSLMGFSPETTVQSALVIRPQKLIVVYSGDERSQEVAKPGIQYLLSEQIVSPFNISFVEIDAFDPQDIYDKVRERIGGIKNLILDITGGTKIMSATAGALAWELNLPMCYLDGGWNPESGSAGLKRVSRLDIKRNPSRSRGYQYRREALAAYQRGNFVVAFERFAESRRLIDDSFFDALGLNLCRCYSALADFDRVQLNNALSQLSETLEMGGVRRLVGNRNDFDSHLRALQSFAAGDLFAMTAGFAELAEIYACQNRHDFSGLLWYRAIEALIEWRLERLAPGFKMQRPDWTKLTCGIHPNIHDEASLRAEYAKLFQDSDSELPSRVTLQSGFALLCVLTDLGSTFREAGSRKAALMMMTLGAIRNRSYLAHGLENLSASDADSLRDGANDLAKAVLGDEHAEFEQLRGHLRPRDLRDIDTK